MIRSHQSFWNRMLILGDLSTSLSALLAVWHVRFKLGLFTSVDHISLPGIFIISVGVAVYISNTLNGLYRPMRKEELVREFFSLSRSHLILGTILMSLLYLLKLTDFPRSVLIPYLVVSLTLMTIFRMFVRVVLRRLREAGYNQKQILLVGTSKYSVELVRGTITNYPWMGYRIKELMIPNGLDTIDSFGALQAQLEDILESDLIDEVVLVAPGRNIQGVANLMAVCEFHGVPISIIPDYFEILPPKPLVNDFGGIPAFVCQGVPLDDPFNSMVKRGFDILFSTLVLLVTTPVLLSIAIGIKLTSPGPIIFRQIRVGKNRRPFTIYKFRTMHTPEHVNRYATFADRVDLPAEQIAASLEGWTVKHDPRRTTFGAFLRRTSLDELPQFWNVLKGHMSVIGPRPEQPKFVDEFKVTIPKYMAKHHVKPGITGWAQVNGWRGDTSISERINCDLYYIENWSFRMDLKIVWLTLFKGLIHTNAY